MMKFTVEETNLICIYDPHTRQNLIRNLLKLKSRLNSDEVDFQRLLVNLVIKLMKMNDSEFEGRRIEFIADYH